MEDREFNRLQIENTDGQIHTENDAAHAVEELPLRAVAEREDVAESYRTDETGMTPQEYAREPATTAIKTETKKATVNIISTSTVSAPIIAALAVVVSAALVVTSVVNSLSVKVALQMKTAFSLIFSLVIQNPDEVPLFAVLSSDGQDDIVRPLQADDTELVFENLNPDTKYTLKILKIVEGDGDREIRETLFEKFYYTARGDGQEPPVVYTVTEEEWNAAFASEAFGNVTVRMNSYSEYNGETEDRENGTSIVIANGYMLQLSDGWTELRPVDEGETVFERMEFFREMEGLSFADFTFDEASNLYRYAQVEGGERQGEEEFEQSSAVKYAVGFRNGKLTSFEQTYEYSYGETERQRSVSRYSFDQYGTSFVTVKEADGIGYVTSSASDSWIAYEWIDRERTEITIPAEIDGRAVTGIAGYLFNGSEELSTVYLPGSLVSLGYNFSNCSNLSAIHYDGTREQWEKLAENLYLPDTVTVYFSDGTNTAEPDQPYSENGRT